MKQVLLAISCLLLSVCATAQDQPNLISPSKVTTIGYWARGEKKVYHVTNSDEITASGSTAPTKKQANAYDFEIRVVDSTAHSYILDLKYLSTSVQDVDPRLKNVMNSLMTTTVVRYQTDEFGSFLKILNTATLQKDFRQKLEQVKKEITAGKHSEESKMLLKVLDELQAQLSQPANIEVLYLDDILAIHGLYGVEVNTNKSMDIEMEIPCLMDVVLKCTGKLSLQSVNKAKDVAVITLKSKPNQEELKKYMKTFFDAFVPKEAGEVKLEDLKISFDDTQTLTMFLSSGWMQSIQTTRTINIAFAAEKLKKVTTTTYQLK